MNLESRFPDAYGFLKRRLSPEAYFGLYLTGGFLLCVSCGWIFTDIAEDVVTHDSIVKWDEAIAQWLHQQATPTFSKAMLALTDTASATGMTVLSILLVIFLLVKRWWPWLTAWSIAIPGGLLLNLALKSVFHRPRPVFSDPIVTLHDFSFPSGHTMVAALFYGFLGTMILAKMPKCQNAKMPKRRLAICLAVGCLVAVGIVAFTRIYLGAHFLSDVLAGATAGFTWLAISLTGVETFRQIKKKRLSQG